MDNSREFARNWCQGDGDVCHCKKIIFPVKNLFFREIDLPTVPTHGGPENMKKSRPKKLVKSNKSISRNIFLHIFHKK